MRWITRRNLHIDRTASAWLIRRFLDPEAEFAFVPADADPSTLDGHTFDMRGAEYSHGEERCTFQTLLEGYRLTADAALVELGRIIGDADVPPSRTRRPEAEGMAAFCTGLQTTCPDDYEKLRVSAPLYDALYAYCQGKVASRRPSRGTPRPRLRYAERVARHLDEPAP